MSTSLMISALRRGKNGEEILNILEAITGNSIQPEETQSDLQPGYVMTWDGRQVQF